ncbi:hypothetical protein EVG20_g3909, partial [Dentipellis fragilis]
RDIDLKVTSRADAENQRHDSALRNGEAHPMSGKSKSLTPCRMAVIWLTTKDPFNRRSHLWRQWRRSSAARALGSVINSCNPRKGLDLRACLKHHGLDGMLKSSADPCAWLLVRNARGLGHGPSPDDLRQLQHHQAGAHLPLCVTYSPNKQRCSSSRTDTFVATRTSDNFSIMMRTHVCLCVTYNTSSSHAEATCRSTPSSPQISRQPTQQPRTLLSRSCDIVNMRPRTAPGSPNISVWTRHKPSMIDEASGNPKEPKDKATDLSTDTDMVH